MRNRQATHNQFAVSANAMEASLNTAATLDTLMLIAMEDMAKVEPRRETNEDEATGYEEPTEVYQLGYTGAYDLNFKRGQAQHFAFILGYAFGQPTTVAAGSTGYKHTWELKNFQGFLDSARSNPTFTCAQRYGQILKRLIYGNFIKNFRVSLAKDSWASATASIGSTGKFDTNMTKESLVAKEDATTITLAANGVAGATAAERLANVDFIRCTMSGGEKKYVAFSAVSGATPAIITITAPGVLNADRTYEVCYLNASQPAWATFPAKVSEPPLRTTDFAVTIGGKWSGTAIAGGKLMSGELSSLEWTFTNEGLEPEFVPGGVSGYATRCLRRARTQQLNINRDFMDAMLQQYAVDNEAFAVKAIAEGSEYESGHKYTVEIIWPRVMVLTPTLAVDNKLMSEQATLSILEDETYGSVIVNIKNKVATYAA